MEGGLRDGGGVHTGGEACCRVSEPVRGEEASRRGGSGNGDKMRVTHKGTDHRSLISSPEDSRRQISHCWERALQT